MNANDPKEEKKVKTARYFLRVFAVLVAVEALLQGIQLIATGGGSALLGFVVMALLLVLAWGLWQLKNWARIGLVIVIVITFILQLIGAGSSFADNAGLIFGAIFVGFILRAAIVYWLLTMKLNTAISV